jgi:MFS family permease
VAAFLVGVYQVADTSANSAFVMELAPEGRRARYLIASNALLVPLAAGLPYLAGWTADHVGPGPVQLVSAVAFTLAAIYMIFLVPERRPHEEEPAPRPRPSPVAAASEA